jgi:two-component system copper resistance phosphate regulon response regulator CusR
MRVLVVDDSERLRKALKEGLTRSGFTVDLAGDGAEGLNYLKTNAYDVVVLDLLMPRVDGLSLLKQIRAEGNDVSVLILSAKDFIEDRVRGLDAGADDYLVKPFSFEELVARIRSMGRRRYDMASPQLEVGPVALDASSRQVRAGDVDIELTRAEYKLLEALMMSRGRVLSKSQLIDRIHDSNANVSDNVVEVLISGLRKKLREAGIEDFVKTKRGFGYTIDL